MTSWVLQEIEAWHVGGGYAIRRDLSFLGSHGVRGGGDGVFLGGFHKDSVKVPCNDNLFESNDCYGIGIPSGTASCSWW